MNKAVLLLGSNLDNRQELLSRAHSMIIAEIGPVIIASSIYESEPWGYDSKNSFLNQALLIKTDNSPEKVLEKCLSIEMLLGRTRNDSGTYSDRSIDIDILLYEDLIISDKNLEIPHPRMHERRFCMEPLAEIVPEWNIPTLKKNVQTILEVCEDNSNINIIIIND